MPGETILVVEDNERNRKLIRVLLRVHRYRILEASTADEALTILENTCPDLILMDIQLPEMDGLTLTRIIREQHELKDVPIIALTAYAMKGDQEKFLVSGCNGYISKPIDTREFPHVIEQFLTRSSEDV